MTHAHMMKMREAKLTADIRRMECEDKLAREYLVWLHEDANAFAAYKEAHEPVHDNYGQELSRPMYWAWRAVVKQHPGTPTDAAMRRVRGDI